MSFLFPVVLLMATLLGVSSILQRKLSFVKKFSKLPEGTPWGRGRAAIQSFHSSSREYVRGFQTGSCGFPGLPERVKQGRKAVWEGSGPQVCFSPNNPACCVSFSGVSRRFHLRQVFFLNILGIPLIYPHPLSDPGRNGAAWGHPAYSARAMVPAESSSNEPPKSTRTGNASR